MSKPGQTINISVIREETLSSLNSCLRDREVSPEPSGHHLAAIKMEPH